MSNKFSKKTNPEWFAKSHEVIYENNSSKVEHLFKLYKKDKHISRVVYMNDPVGYENFKLVLFKEENGNFQFVYFRKKFGISISNRIYSSEKRLITITYKEGKFWLIDNSGRYKSIRPLTMNFLNSCFPTTQLGMGESKECELILDILKDRFTWLRFMREHKVMGNIAFNTIIKNKLYNLKKALQFEYKVPRPIAKLMHSSEDHWLKHYFKYYLPYIKNIESLKPEWIESKGINSQIGLLRDTLKMAKILDKKVNCSWSIKRLRLEHDNFTKLINDIIFIGSDRQMKIKPIYSRFQEHSKFQMIKTTKEIALEGKKQNHCVGTYVNKVESGNCGIYRINGFTLELNVRYDKKTNKPLLTIGQLRGYANCNPPEELSNMISEKVKEFNFNLLSEIGVERQDLTDYNMDDFISNSESWDELPF